MTANLSLPMFNPHTGRLGTHLESLRTGMDTRDACSATEPLPMTVLEARRRGWDELDIVFITGDAYIDHPSFAMAILGRVLEAAGFRVGIVSQPAAVLCD
jgi:hypothetical protein